MGHPKNAYLILIFYYLLKLNYIDNDDVYCHVMGNNSVKPDKAGVIPLLNRKKQLTKPLIDDILKCA